jgi:hypothetical protein
MYYELQPTNPPLDDNEEVFASCDSCGGLENESRLNHANESGFAVLYCDECYFAYLKNYNNE